MTSNNSIDFRGFYNSHLGRVAKQLIIARLKQIFDAPRACTGDARIVAALGYPEPYLPFLDSVFDRIAGLQSEGIEHCRPLSSEHSGRLALTDSGRLPLLPSSLDALLLVHALEGTSEQAALLDESWDALKGNGQFVLIVPHRGSIWSARETTPFGYGQPYSVNQIKMMLKDHHFDINKIYRALAAPPLRLFFSPRVATLIERLAHPLGGVLIVDARKMVYSVRGIRVGAKKAFKPALAGMNPNAMPSTGTINREEQE